MSSSKNNVNPDHYKTAGRTRTGQDVNQEIQKQKYTEAQAKFNHALENESGSEFISGGTPALPHSSNPAATKKNAGKDNERDKKSSGRA